MVSNNLPVFYLNDSTTQLKHNGYIYDKLEWSVNFIFMLLKEG